MVRRSSNVLPVGHLVWLGLTLVLVLLLGAARPAAAGPVLVLGFVEEGKPNARVRQSVIQFLQRMGEEVVGPSLPTADQLCTQSDCLGRLGERHGAQRILGGELIPNDNSYRIQVWLFDRTSEMPSSAETVCTDCNAELLADTVSRTAGNVLEAGAVQQQQQQQVQRPAAPSPPVQSQTAACRTPYRTFGRGIALGSMAALTLAGLTTGLVLAGYNGQPYQPGNSDSPHYSFANHTALALGLTAAPALGLTAAALPWHSLLHSPGHRSGLGVCPTDRGRWSFGRGMAIGALGSLGVAGLASAFALTAVSGSVYAMNQDGSALTYDLKPHYTAASVAAGAMIAGLALAIFIP